MLLNKLLNTSNSMCFGVFIVEHFVYKSACGFVDFDPYLLDLVIGIPHKSRLLWIGGVLLYDSHKTIYMVRYIST